MNYAPFITKEEETCGDCGWVIPEATNAFCTNDGEIVCGDCHGHLEARADAAYESWKEEQII